MNWVRKIQEAVNYIEEHLHDEINIDSVAGEIHYAPSSFQNLFSAITGYSIGEYIRFRRLTCAADDLADGQLSVTDVAFKYGYETAEAFSKAFKRAYDVSPSKFIKTNSNYHKFAPLQIHFQIRGGFDMDRNFIPGLMEIKWRENGRTSEYVWSILSTLGALGEKLDYDEVAAVSGCCFRTSYKGFHHDNYHTYNAKWTIGHTFSMLGYKATLYKRSDFETDKKLFMDSIDKGVPVIAFGCFPYSDACVISGYDNDGGVLLGYSAYMDGADGHNEPHDVTGYFRLPSWHNGPFERRGGGHFLIIEEKIEKPSQETVFRETLKLAKKLIHEGVGEFGQFNGLEAQTAYADALLSYNGANHDDVYLCLMCCAMMYNDKMFAARYLRENGREDLAGIYDDIGALRNRLREIIPEDFSAPEKFGDRLVLEQYADALLQIRDLEARFAGCLE